MNRGKHEERIGRSCLCRKCVHGPAQRAALKRINIRKIRKTESDVIDEQLDEMEISLPLSDHPVFRT